MSATANTHLTFLHPLARRDGIALASAAPGALARALATLKVWRNRSRGRRELLQLDYRDLRDMGVAPADAYWEAAQPFWRETGRR